MKHKICHISLLYRPYFAGRAVYLEKEVFKEFHKNGIENIVVTADYDNLPKHEIIDNVEVYRIPIRRNCKKWNLIFSAKAILCLLKIRDKFKIIHLHGLWDIYGFFTIFSKLFRKKIILHMTLLGNDDPVAIMKMYKLMNIRFRLLSKIDAFIPISSPMSNSYRKTILPQAKLHQIHNGVDTELFFPPLSNKEKRIIREKLLLPEQPKITVFVGAIIKRKGVDTLIEAWKEVNKQIPTALLILIGPDSFDGFDTDSTPYIKFANKMKKIVFEKKLNIKFIGRSDEVPLFLRASDLFVLPSRREGFGNVVVEAMSTGLPLILTKMDGISYDLIEQGQQGFIVNSSKELSEKIVYLLENEGDLIAMGKKARKRALEKFDLDYICCKYISLYDQLLDN